MENFGSHINKIDKDVYDLTILGVHLYSSAYPNTKFVIDLIRCSECITCGEINKPLFSKRLGIRGDQGVFSKLCESIRFAVRVVYCHCYVILRGCIAHNLNVVYIPYPAVGVLAIYSFLPTALRPEKIVAEAFISIYDTAVIDRKLLTPIGVAARMLRWIERRAYSAASVVIVDTEENSRYYASLFDLPESKFTPVPLATDEHNYAYRSYTKDKSVCNVLFVGTFVPLQGVDIIAHAINSLKYREDIKFTVLGSGQSALQFANIIGQVIPDNLIWFQEWEDSVGVAALIDSADMCLGIFSEAHKTERVWPFKNYAYMACGRAIITGDTECARRLLADQPDPAFVTVPTGNADALAQKIELLADSPDMREKLSQNARKFYEHHLCNRLVEKKLIEEILLK